MRDLCTELKMNDTVGIIGGGLCGIELANQISGMGKRVYMIEQKDTLAGQYYDQDICLEIRKELEKKGFNVYVLTYYDNEQRNIKKCHGVQLGWLKRRVEALRNYDDGFKKLQFYLLSTLRRILISPFYPFIPSLAFIRYKHRAQKLIKEYNTDIIISFYKPYDPVACAMNLKKKFEKNLVSISYHLDLLNVPEDGNNFIGRYKKHKALRAFSKEKKYMDMIIVPLSEKGKYSSNKIKYVDFPLYIPEIGKVTDFEFDNDTINLVYVGSLDDHNRNPEYLFRMIYKINLIGKRKVVLHIWGKLSKCCIAACNKYVEYHGLIENEYVLDLLKKSDFVINVSNGITYQWIPSKIFQLFASKKPIINIIRNPKDASLKYFAKYQNVCSIKEYEDNIDDDIDILLHYIEEPHKVDVDIDSLFERSTPGFFVKQIKELLYD